MKKAVVVLVMTGLTSFGAWAQSNPSSKFKLCSCDTATNLCITVSDDGSRLLESPANTCTSRLKSQFKFFRENAKCMALVRNNQKVEVGASRCGPFAGLQK